MKLFSRKKYHDKITIIYKSIDSSDPDVTRTIWPDDTLNIIGSENNVFLEITQDGWQTVTIKQGSPFLTIADKDLRAWQEWINGKVDNVV